MRLSSKKKLSADPSELKKTIPCAKLTASGVCPEGRNCDYSHKIPAKFYSGTGFMDYVVPMITEITKAQILVNQQLTQVLERLAAMEARVDKTMEALVALHKKVDRSASRRGQNRASSRHARDEQDDK